MSSINYIHKNLIFQGTDCVSKPIDYYEISSLINIEKVTLKKPQIITGTTGEVLTIWNKGKPLNQILEEIYKASITPQTLSEDYTKVTISGGNTITLKNHILKKKSFLDLSSGNMVDLGEIPTQTIVFRNGSIMFEGLEYTVTGTKLFFTDPFEASSGAEISENVLVLYSI